MIASDYFAEFLHKAGVARIYTLSGGMIAPLLDSIGEHPSLRLIAMAHEQSASFAAQTEGQLSGLPGIAIGTSGPGALNMVTGIASAHYDSTPAVFVSGQVQTYVSNLVPHGRQSALQQTNLLEVCRPICKEALTVSSAKSLPDALAHAFATSLDGRPGPVLIEIPLDIQTGEVGTDEITLPKLPAAIVVDRPIIERFVHDVDNAQRPVLLVGGGARVARSAVHEMAGKWGIPVVSTTAGLDVTAGIGQLHFGMCGLYGTRAANTILTEADLVIAVGTRLDHAVIGADPARFSKSRTVWQFEIDHGEAGARSKNISVVLGDARLSLPLALQTLPAYHSDKNWIDRVTRIAKQFPTTGEQPRSDSIDPNVFFECLSRASHECACFVVDAGHHTWFAGQSMALAAGQRFVCSTGLHACGTSLPAAIAAAHTLGRPVLAIAGDGAIQLNIQELAIVKRDRLPVKVVILNNHAHGSVRQFQKEFTGGRYHATVWGMPDPDFVAVFNAYGLPGRTISKPTEIEGAVQWLWSTPEAQVLEVVVDTMMDIRPAVPFGHQISSMRPLSQGGQ